MYVQDTLLALPLYARPLGAILRNVILRYFVARRAHGLRSAFFGRFIFVVLLFLVFRFVSVSLLILSVVPRGYFRRRYVKCASQGLS